MVLCEFKFHLVYTASSSTARATKEDPVSDKTNQTKPKQNKCPKLNHPKPGTIDHLSMHQHTQAHMGQGTDPLSAMFTQALHMCPCTQAYTYSCTQQLCLLSLISPAYPRTKHLCPYWHRHSYAHYSHAHVCSIPCVKKDYSLVLFGLTVWRVKEVAGAVGAGLPGGMSGCVDICKAELPGVLLTYYKRSQTKNVTETFYSVLQSLPTGRP